jgi:protein TonB
MIDRYKQTLQIDPNNPQAAEGLRKIAQAYLELGKLSEASNDKAKARERYRKALEVNPQLREAREALKLLDAAPVAAESSNASSASRELTESRETVTAAGAATRAPRSGKPPMAGSGQTTKVKIYETTDVDVKPEAIFEVPPVYPSDALKRGLQDIIILKVLISEEGSVLDTQILRGARQDKQFEKAAIEAVQKWKFQPAQKGSQTVRVWFNVAVPFQISKQ